MGGNCSKSKKCKSFKDIGCSGCGYQHFDSIPVNPENREAIEYMKNEYFALCSENRMSTGARIPFDQPLKKLVTQEARLIIPEFPELIVLATSDLIEIMEIDGEKIRFSPKYDAAFCVKRGNNVTRYVFCEIKGYGKDSNSVMSAILAAQMLREIPQYKDCKYYYIGSSGGGLFRRDFFDPESKLFCTVKWAESKGIIKFYGINDIMDLLHEIKSY